MEVTGYCFDTRFPKFEDIFSIPLSFKESALGSTRNEATDSTLTRSLPPGSQILPGFDRISSTYDF